MEYYKNLNQALEAKSTGLQRFNFTVAEKLNVLANYRQALAHRFMPAKTIVDRAKKIKPLARICFDTEQTGARMLDFDEDESHSTLVFINPLDIKQSCAYNFSPKDIARTFDGKPIVATGLHKVTAFTCYHEYGVDHAFLRPSIDEVMAQIPSDVNLEEIDAFELRFLSDRASEIYDSRLDRHVSEITLYKLANGLPEEIRSQPVIFMDRVFSS